MADWAKIALKVGLVAGVMAGIWAVFTMIQIPVIDFSTILQTSSFAMSFLQYWCPAFITVWNASLVLIAVLIALWTWRFGSIAIRWLFKVNE